MPGPCGIPHDRGSRTCHPPHRVPKDPDQATQAPLETPYMGLRGTYIYLAGGQKDPGKVTQVPQNPTLRAHKPGTQCPGKYKCLGQVIWVLPDLRKDLAIRLITSGPRVHF